MITIFNFNDGKIVTPLLHRLSMLSVRKLGASTKSQSVYKITNVKLTRDCIKFEGSSLDMDARPIASIINIKFRNNNQLDIMFKKPSVKITVSNLSTEELRRIENHVNDKRKRIASFGGDVSKLEIESSTAISSDAFGSEVTVAKIEVPNVAVDIKKEEDMPNVHNSSVVDNIANDAEESQEPPLKKRKIMPFEPEPVDIPVIEPVALYPKTVSLFNHYIPTFHGFANMGNTCYLNAVLVSLLFNSQLVNEIKSSDLPLVKELSSLLQLKIKDPMYIEPTNLKGLIDSLTVDFVGDYQHDAHEFLTKLVDLCKLDEFFNLNLKKVLKCKNNHESYTNEVCFGIGVGIHGSVLEGIHNFFKSEKLEYNCEKCESTHSTLKYQVVDTPNILVVHLKRFKLDLNFETLKITDPVTMNKNLNIGNVKYELYSVVCHFGKYGGGHYTCNVLVDEQWICFDDTQCSVFKEDHSASGYLLFYKKKTVV